MTRQPERPIPESYWVVPGKLLAGEFPGRFDGTLTRQRLNHFLKQGVNAYVDLTKASELPSYEPLLYEQARIIGVEAVYARLPIRDRGLPSAKLMKAILDNLDASVEADRKVYLHCWGGVGRTGTVVGCWLVRHGAEPLQALAEVARLFATMTPQKREAHPEGSPQTAAQRDFVRRWREEVQGR